MKSKANGIFKKKNKKKHRKDSSCFVCWIIVPLALICLLVLDGLGLYLFNTERLVVIGVCIIVVLIPFFSEITIKSISLKKETNHNENPKS